MANRIRNAIIFIIVFAFLTGIVMGIMIGWARAGVSFSPRGAFFGMFDYANTDYAALYPGRRSIIGSHAMFYWKDINTADGVYNWSQIDSFINTAAGQTATDPAGNQYAKPVAIGISIMGGVDDYTPEWVYTQYGHSVMVNGRRVGYALNAGGSCPITSMPWYDSPQWKDELQKMIRAFGARYNGRVAAVYIGAGMEDETQPAKNFSYGVYNGCKYGDKAIELITLDGYKQFVKDISRMHSEAFPDTPVFLQAATVPSGGSYLFRKEIMEYAASLKPPVGYKSNGWEPDNYGSGALGTSGAGNNIGWEKIDIIGRYSQTIPTALEPAWGPGTADDSPTPPYPYGTRAGGTKYAYWMILRGLHYGITTFDMQPGWFNKLDAIPWIWPFIWRSLGTTASNSQNVWVVFRDAECQDIQFTSTGQACDKGDYQHYLSVSNPLSTTHLTQSSFPSVSLAQPYSRHARSTSTEIRLRADAGWVYRNATDYRYRVTVWYLDQGTDTWSLTYWNGTSPVTETITKTDTGEFKGVSWAFQNMKVSGGLNGDDLILGADGGSDVFHMVEILAYHKDALCDPNDWFSPCYGAGPGSQPTSTPTPRPTSTPIPTPQATVTPGADTYIDRWDSGSHATAPLLRIAAGSLGADAVTLLRLDLTGMGQVGYAGLYFCVDGIDGGPVTVLIAPVSRSDWSDEATWTKANPTPSYWAAPGMSTAEYVASQGVSFDIQTTGCYTADVTIPVNYLIQQGWYTNGLVIRPLY